MDTDRFDYLTRSFAISDSRRGIMKLAAAGLAALGIDSALADEAGAAKCVKPGRRCKTRNGKKKCCRGSKCVGTTCQCKGNKEQCGKQCVNLNNNSKNCGSCGNPCPSGSSCESGLCTNDCPDECCANSDCPGTEVCQDGSCTCTTECCRHSDCSGSEICQGGSCTCTAECCVNEDCPGLEVCSQNGACICATECCLNSDCPQPGGTCQPNGTCNCGECCVNEDCPANENCVLVNDTRFCFCKPELLCGDPPVACCNVGQTCNQGTGICV